MTMRIWGLGLLAAAVLINATCGGGSGNVGILQPKMGSLAIIGGDAPACNVLAADVTISSATLTPQGGGSPVSVISSSSPVNVDLASLADLRTVLALTTVPAGTYSTLTTQLVIPPPCVFSAGPTQCSVTSAPLLSITLTFNLNPALVVSTSAPAVLDLDFNLIQSGETPANITAQVTIPTVSVTNGFGELDDLSGIVQSVSTPAAGSSFTGSFTIPMPGQSNQTLTINTNSATLLDNITALSGLVADKTFVEVDAFLDANGNLVAKEVDAEAQENAAQSQAAFAGLITSVTRNSSGNATAATILLRAADPPLNGLSSFESLSVTIPSSAQFQVFPRALNRGNLPFGAANLGTGQEVVIHGQLQTGSPPMLAASVIFLHTQSAFGTLAATPAPVIGSDGLTGGFTLAPCSTLPGQSSMSVFTFSTTAFPGVSGGNLAGLAAGSTLIAKGLMFYEPQATSVNSMAGLTPGLVIEAGQVHQLP